MSGALAQTKGMHGYVFTLLCRVPVCCCSLAEFRSHSHTMLAASLLVLAHVSLLVQLAIGSVRLAVILCHLRLRGVLRVAAIIEGS